MIVAYMQIIATSDSTGVVVTDTTPTYQGSDSTGAIAIKIVRPFLIPQSCERAAIDYVSISGFKIITLMSINGILGKYSVVGTTIPLSDCMAVFGRGAGAIVESGDATYVTQALEPYYAPGLWSWLVSREHR